MIIEKSSRFLTRSNFLALGDVKSLSPERSPIAMKDVKWLSHNCTVGFLVAGMWNNRYYTNSAAIIATCNRSAAQDMLVSGDMEGYLRLFRYILHFTISISIASQLYY